MKGRYVVSARAAVARQAHDHQFGEVFERDHHDTAFGEVTVRGGSGRHTWVGGLAVERSAFTPRDVPRFGTSSWSRAGSRSTTSVSAVRGQCRPAGASMFIANTARSSALGSRRWALRPMDEPGLRWQRILRADAAHRGDRSRRSHAAPNRRAARWPSAASAGCSISRERTVRFLDTATLFASRISDPIHVD